MHKKQSDSKIEHNGNFMRGALQSFAWVTALGLLAYLTSVGCVGERIVGCGSGEECGGGAVCIDNQCVVVCTQDSDCTEGRCSEGSCTSECSDDSDCARDRICSEPTQKCETGCLDDSDCSFPKICSGGVCMEQRCDNDTPCRFGAVCVGNPMCEAAPCSELEDCASGLACDSERCLPTPCGDDCPKGFVCDPARQGETIDRCLPAP